MTDPTAGGCTCGTCHWCKWSSDPVEAIKMLINKLADRDCRLEAVNEQQGHFFLADRYRDSRKGKLEILDWIERQQERALSEEPQP